jgi:hypothetical protein
MNTDNLFETHVRAHLVPLRGEMVILDSDLAWFLGVEPSALIANVEDNPSQFPDDFVFRLTHRELMALQDRSPSLTGGGLQPGRPRLTFTTHGVGMLLAFFTDERFALNAIPVLRAFSNHWKQEEAAYSRSHRKS